MKKRYIQLATQHQFLDAILQDPPRQVQPDQVKELGKKEKVQMVHEHTSISH